MAEVAVASKAAIKMRKETAGFVGAMIVAAIIALFYYQHFQSIQCEPCLSDLPCPPCSSENRHYVLPIFIGVEVILIALFFVRRRLLNRSTILR